MEQWSSANAKLVDKTYLSEGPASRSDAGLFFFYAALSILAEYLGKFLRIDV